MLSWFYFQFRILLASMTIIGTRYRKLRPLSQWAYWLPASTSTRPTRETSTTQLSRTQTPATAGHKPWPTGYPHPQVQSLHVRPAALHSCHEPWPTGYPHPQVQGLHERPAPHGCHEPWPTGYPHPQVQGLHERPALHGCHKPKHCHQHNRPAL